MSLQRFYVGMLDQLSDDEVGGIAISAGVKRDGCEWVPSGVDLSGYRQNPVVLKGHDPDSIIGAASSIGLTADGSAIGIRIQFAPAGVSAVADEARGLAKAGILRGISAGIDPIDTEPLGNGTRGVRILTSELLEVSLVACPADSSALITARSFQARHSTLAMLRSLPAVSRTAMEQALAQVGQTREPSRPIGLMSPYEQARVYAAAHRARTMAAWAGSQAREAEGREREAAMSYEQRQADLRALSDDRTH